MGRFTLLDSLPPLPSWTRRQQEPSEPYWLDLSAAPQAATRSTGRNIDVSLEDRWLILGATGTGKTFFARELIKDLHRLWPEVPVQILDTKQYGDFSEWYGNGGLIQGQQLPPLIMKGFQVWQPWDDDLDLYGAWFRRILQAPGASITLIDEISSISDDRGHAPRDFGILLKQGRAPKKLVISCTQEMAYTPKQIRTQTTHVARFRFADTGYDNQKANRIMGRANNAPEPSHQYGFFYRRIDKFMDVVEYAACQDFF